MSNVPTLAHNFQYPAQREASHVLEVCSMTICPRDTGSNTWMHANNDHLSVWSLENTSTHFSYVSTQSTKPTWSS